MGVIGAGPAGSFFSYFLLDFADRVGTDVNLDVYEARDFSLAGPRGCNMCGGIISETLVQMLAAEGINLPPSVVQRCIDAYVLHTNTGTVRIETPLHELRIAAVHRGSGPRGAGADRWESFDGFLLNLARERGANVFRARVEAVSWEDGRPRLHPREGSPKTYDLLVGAVGVNSPTLKLFRTLDPRYRPPRTTRTFISEFHLGRSGVNQALGSAMHVFLLGVPRLDFAALIPKGEYVTMCLLGKQLDHEVVSQFLDNPEVRSCLPSQRSLSDSACRCSPVMNVAGAAHPFSDRVVLIGDCGVSRLYKDGIGAAYRTAKSAALASVFSGVSRRDLRGRYWPACRLIAKDNGYGRAVFLFLGLIRRLRVLRRGMVRMAQREQSVPGRKRKMSVVMWNAFTGSAPYRDCFLATLRPGFILRLLVETIKPLLTGASGRDGSIP